MLMYWYVVWLCVSSGSGWCCWMYNWGGGEVWGWNFWLHNQHQVYNMAQRSLLGVQTECEEVHSYHWLYKGAKGALCSFRLWILSGKRIEYNPSFLTDDYHLSLLLNSVWLVMVKHLPSNVYFEFQTTSFSNVWSYIFCTEHCINCKVTLIVVLGYILRWLYSTHK